MPPPPKHRKADFVKTTVIFTLVSSLELPALGSAGGRGYAEVFASTGPLRWAMVVDEL